MPIRIEDAVNTAPPAGGDKKLFVKSYGCQMNVYDGFRMAELLAPEGYTLTDSATNADMVVLNTCHIREKADDKMFSDLGRFRREAKSTAVLAVGGCTGQALGAKIMEQAPAVSIVFGPQTYHRLPAMLKKVEEGRALRADGHKNAPIRAVDTEFPELEKFDHLPRPGVYGPTAFVTIQEGCDKFCTYCVVPYTRGAEISRPWRHVVDEVRILADQGVKEITLLGQNVNAYLNDGITLAALCDKVANVEGIARVRFTTSHPMNTGDDLIAAFADNPKLMPFFHLPVQAGSNRILKAMNRSHTVESYLDTIAKVRAARPDVAISGDFIVGFPGETEEDFQQTLAVAHAVQYVGAYSFAYSPRPGTPAATLDGQVDEIIKKERLAALNVVLDDSLAAFAKRFDGRTVDVLVEGSGGRADKYGEPQLRGRSPHNLPVNFTYGQADPVALVGEMVNVRITHTTAKGLVGVLA